MSIITMTFAARDFSARRGASDEHTLQGSVRSEQRSLAEKDQPQHKRQQGRQTRVDQDRYKKNDFQARQQHMGEACQENTSDEANEPRRKKRADDVESGRSGAP